MSDGRRQALARASEPRAGNFAKGAPEATAGKGPARGYSWPAFQRGNRVAARSGFYVRELSPSEHGDVQEIADAVRDLCPVEADELEPLIQGLAGKLWRRKRAYADLIDNGIVRGSNRLPAPILRDLETLENSIRRDLQALGLTVESAAAIGVNLARSRAAELDFDRLTAGEREQLSRLVAKARNDAEAA